MMRAPVAVALLCALAHSCAAIFADQAGNEWCVPCDVFSVGCIFVMSHTIHSTCCTLPCRQFCRHQSYVGEARHTMFLGAAHRTVALGSDRALAAAQLSSGALVWRQVLPEGERLDRVAHVPPPTSASLTQQSVPLLLTVSNGGSVLRAWSVSSGAMQWEELASTHPHPPASFAPAGADTVCHNASAPSAHEQYLSFPLRAATTAARRQQCAAGCVSIFVFFNLRQLLTPVSVIFFSIVVQRSVRLRAWDTAFGDDTIVSLHHNQIGVRASSTGALRWADEATLSAAGYDLRARFLVTPFAPRIKSPPLNH